jgi:hypothetical protein
MRAYAKVEKTRDAGTAARKPSFPKDAKRGIKAM